MSKLFNWAAARLVAAFALALPLAATAAPTATAVWRSNLGQAYTIGGNTYAVTPRDGTLNQDGTITVSSTWGDKAPYIDLEGANVRIVSVLVKYSGLDISQIYDADGDCIGVAFASIIDSENNVVGSCVQKVNGVANNTVRAYHCGASATSATPRDIGSMTAVEGSGYLLFAFKDSQGSRSYMGTSIGNLTGGEDTAGHWTDRTLKKLVLGGDESGKAFNGAGFKIEEVAIFVGSYLTASDVADYVFPTVTADAAVTTMSALNAKVASLDNEFLYFSNAAVVTLDEEPSEATKAFLQGANWNGTVFIKDQNIVNLNPTIYGNPNSTLKLSGVSGHWGAAVYEKTATPAIELEDSKTEDREYGYYASNGYSFYASGAYYYVHTPELKGSGTYKANTTGNGALFVADKFDNFTGKLHLDGKTVWLGTGAPTKSVDTWNNLVNFPGTVRLGSTIPANYATWNVPNGYKGTVVKTTAANATEAGFLTNSTWKGTCQLNWNPGNTALDIVNYGNANSVVEIVTAFGPYPTQNGGTDGAEFDGEIKLSADWTINNGWTGEGYRTTFAKLSGTGTLTVNGGSGGVGDPIPYTITRLEGFTGTIAGTRGKFTIGTIVAATEPTPGTKLVNFTTANAPVLDNTKVVYNNAEQDVDLEFKAGDGIYVAEPDYVAYTVTVVRNYDDPTDPYSPYTETFTTNYFESINAAIATSPAPDKIYLIDSSIEAPAGWQKSLEDETYVLTPIPPVAYVDGMTSSNGYTDLSEALAAALASGTHTLYIVSSQTLETFTVPDGCTLTLSVPSAMGGALDVSNIVVVSGASLKMASAIEAEYSVSGALELNTGDFSGSSVDLAAVSATCTVRSGVTSPTITTSLADYEVTSDNGTYGVREDKGWIYAEEGYWNYTGTWSGVDVDPSAEAVTIETNATYMANRPSDGQFVTVEMTLSFDAENDEDEDLGDVKTAVKIASGETEGSYAFKLYTTNELGRAWETATVGVTALTNVDYTFVFVLDLTNKTYTASIVDGVTTNAMSVGGSTDIPFASNENAVPVQRIDFIGAGSVTSIKGSYEDAEEPAVFVEDEPIALSDDSVQLSADQAAWLNKLGAKSAVAEALATLSSDQFSSAYLLNLDLTDTFTYEFTVSDITVGDSTVEVEVTLTRTGTLVDGKSSINGTLKLMGGATLPASGFVDLHVAPVGDDDFSDGDTATWSFDKGSEKFFQPVIE